MTSTTQQNGDTGVAREVKQTPLANHKDALRNKPRKAARPKPPDVLKAISEATGPPSLVAASKPVTSPRSSPFLRISPTTPNYFAVVNSGDLPASDSNANHLSRTPLNPAAASEKHGQRPSAKAQINR